jgi:hypothetical protein
LIGDEGNFYKDKIDEPRIPMYMSEERERERENLVHEVG